MIVGKFFKAAEANKFLFAAALFWKTRQDCYLLNFDVAEEGENEGYIR